MEQETCKSIKNSHIYKIEGCEVSVYREFSKEGVCITEAFIGMLLDMMDKNTEKSCTKEEIFE